MRSARRLALAMLAPGLALGLWLVLGGGLSWATLDADRRAAVGAAVEFHDRRSRTFCTRSRVENGLVT